MVSGIDQIIESLATDLKTRVDKVVELTELLEDTQSKLEVAKRDLNRVHIALEALNGSSIPVSIPANPIYTSGDTGSLLTKESSIPQAVLPPPVPKREGPVCTSCGSGTMIYTSRTLNNGKTVTLWLCPECRNERL